MEVYIDNMLVKTKTEDELLQNLETVFSCLRKYRMRLNPHKCVFAVKAMKFLGFMLTNRGIEANPDKCKEILEMKSPSSVKDVYRLTGRIASLSRFLAASSRKASLFFSLLKKGIILNGFRNVRQHSKNSSPICQVHQFCVNWRLANHCFCTSQ